MANVRLEEVTKVYGHAVALRNFSIEIQDGEFLTLLGPSGCGKTTTLRLIAGFIEPTHGRMFIGNEDVTDVPPRRREIGMVFQDYALFPHLTVEENIAYGMARRGLPRDKIRTRVAELLDLTQLRAVARHFPGGISGGQQQRVALARAIAYTPRVLLMDEPLAALDLKLRETMQIEVRRIQRELGITTIYVTHDQAEAMTLSDRIAVMNLGELVQLGTAEELYNQPRSAFTAGFVGKINFLPACVVGYEEDWAVAVTAGTRLRVRNEPSLGVGQQITVAIRPERLHLAQAETTPSGQNELFGTVGGRRFIGNLTHVFVQAGKDLSLTVELGPGGPVLQGGEAVRVTWNPDDAYILHEEKPLAPSESADA